jgi:hypothetical protein
VDLALGQSCQVGMRMLAEVQQAWHMVRDVHWAPYIQAAQVSDRWRPC